MNWETNSYGYYGINADYYYNDLMSNPIFINNFTNCMAYCQVYPGCTMVSYSLNGSCWLKQNVNVSVNVISVVTNRTTGIIAVNPLITYSSYRTFLVLIIFQFL